ncbi:VOC family protein [uncultured Streptomyces sp.]|uniref:VOC family protein n=1 Tax=uncultured Streptomyces sp. TaxID=174707 RepID=UPI002628E542|nr:VOC family protein [uncultured Streptomyces sp.]
MIRWTYVFVDRPAPHADPASAFWATVTGTRVGAPWGDRGEFRSLEPVGADPCLVVQTVGVAGPAGSVHPDFAVDDPGAFADRAVTLGATVVSRTPGLTVLRSPAGQPFCVVAWRGQRVRPDVVTDPRGGVSRADQVCLDVAPDAFAAEVVFWAELTGWRSRADSLAEFHTVRPAGIDSPVQLLLQRLDEPRPASAHLDLACTDIAATRDWHEECGAGFVAEYPEWSVMRDPSGAPYCLTGRDPWTGGGRAAGDGG